MSPGTNVWRIKLGTELRALREQAKLTLDAISGVMEWSTSRMSRLENGHTGIRLMDLTALLDRYGVADARRRNEVFALARQARSNNAAYTEDVFADFALYLAMEASATSVRAYEALYIPGLLQASDYTTATLLAARPNLTPEKVDHLVELRHRRQELLTRADAPTVWAVIDEAALHKPVGSPESMRAQLRHLLDVSELPNVTVQVIPSSVGAYPGMGWSLVLVSLSEDMTADVAYSEGATGGVYLGAASDIARYSEMYDYWRSVALPDTQSGRLIEQVAKNL